MPHPDNYSEKVFNKSHFGDAPARERAIEDVREEFEALVEHHASAFLEEARELVKAHEWHEEIVVENIEIESMAKHNDCAAALREEGGHRGHSIKHYSDVYEYMKIGIAQTMANGFRISDD